LDPALLRLWRRLVATAPIRPLAWESPCAIGAALERAKRQKKKKKVYNYVPWMFPRMFKVLTLSSTRLVAS